MMTKVFFILWFMFSGNYHTLEMVKLDTEAECKAAGRAIVESYNAERGWNAMSIDDFKCIKVEVK